MLVLRVSRRFTVLLLVNLKSLRKRISAKPLAYRELYEALLVLRVAAEIAFESA